MSSQFIVQKEIVLQAAQHAIDEILSKRKAFLEEKIDKAMKRLIFPPKTREKAKKDIIRKARMFGYFEDFSHYGEAEARIAVGLRAGCRLCEDDFVFIDRKDADFVEMWR
jgi:hypothetical protein